MAKEINKENEVKVDMVTGEVMENATEKKNIEIIDVDSFESRRARDESQDSQREGDRVVYRVPLTVKRYTNGNVSDNGRLYYSYAVGYASKLNGKVISQTIDLEPEAKRADTYDFLDAIFGEGDAMPLEIVKTTTTTTLNGVTRRNVSYSFRVSAVDEDGVEVVAILGTTRGCSGKKENLIAKLKAAGHID